MYVKFDLTLWEEQRQGFGNRVLRRIFGPKRGEMIGAWIKLLNDEFHNLYIFVKCN
jgi:hypothetical protein